MKHPPGVGESSSYSVMGTNLKIQRRSKEPIVLRQSNFKNLKLQRSRDTYDGGLGLDQGDELK